MTESRRKFRREGEAQRQGDLIAAALDLIAEGGPQAATVRAIADRAGVTPGLIRHYFHRKEDLIAAAYSAFAEQMTADHRTMLEGAGPDPLARLSRYVDRALRPPLTDPRQVALWAGFLHLVQSDPEMRAVHRTAYSAFREELRLLIEAAFAAEGRTADAARLRVEATACNALIDGLWLEGLVLSEEFTEAELARLGVAKIGALLDLPLERYLEE
ncbi:TetR/AcrR family transcriptional regulator [Solirhodobacter olei]|uniref:TetR/AcrR family transcriptional regulator n=1 Tax=Solirhodobacter olei TaxID=2493082 RepID=UPI000FD8B929|nr:TetR family transcriptional regulator C-terminal domain-containing protein [Solirhodobacter olei]